MAKKAGKRSAAKAFWGLNTAGLLASATTKKPSKGTPHLWIAGKKAPAECPRWLWQEVTDPARDKQWGHWTDDDGPHWVVAPEAGPAKGPGAQPSSLYGLFRDTVGLAVADITDRRFSELHVESLLSDSGKDRERALGALVGVEIGHYRFTRTQQKQIALSLGGVAADVVKEATTLGVGTNVARHLVNVPAGDLTPGTFAASLQRYFSGTKMGVEVWNDKKLATEKCGMLLAVGRAAKDKACLVRLKYRPAGAKGKPLAFVGKGVTFDSGGLDIKSAAGMRLMKKDMGGSASVVGLAFWAFQSGVKRPLDFYLALAENAIDGNAFRPGDILTARNGVTVEIHNTDAEGRLCLGDALDVANTRKGKDEPEAIIDLATLTGAMRVALGLQVAGYFSTDDGLAEQVAKAAALRGDPLWRMPFIDEYKPMLASNFADMSNSAAVGFGGAITAALFLRRFVGDRPWVHIDMMGWTDKRNGALAEPGGNGQVVQALAQFLQD